MLECQKLVDFVLLILDQGDGEQENKALDNSSPPLTSPKTPQKQSTPGKKTSKQSSVSLEVKGYSQLEDFILAHTIFNCETSV